MEDAGGNISLALRNILMDIKPIGVIKCRFKSAEVKIYGLLLFIFNSRTKKMLRHAAVAGCNPSIYEADIKKQWFAFEKELYSSRLKDGSLREITQNIEQLLLFKAQEYENKIFYRYWSAEDIKSIKDIIKEDLTESVKYDTGLDCDIDIEIEIQKLNLRQFKYLTTTEKVMDEFNFHLTDEEAYSSLIALDIEIIRNKNRSPFIRVEDIEAGDMVYTNIIDDRDIGIYLSRLLGARKGREIIPLSASVEDVKDTPEGVEIIVRFGPGIVGRAIENPYKKIGIIEVLEEKPRWWIYIVIALSIAILYYLLRK